MIYTRYFRCESETHSEALEKIKQILKQENINLTGIEVVYEDKIKNAYCFLLKANIETDMSKSQLENQLSRDIYEYCPEYTDIDQPDILIGYVQEDYEHQDVEFSTEYLDYDVKMSKYDIFEAYREMQRRFNGDTIEIPEEDYSEIYEGNLKVFIELCNELEGFKRFDDEEELDFCF